MRVTFLELHNVKSYAGPTRIDLTEGLNAICGANGSGKTTVLEAIGFALFDFQPYTRESFVREGERHGLVRVGLLARDGREYEIVRRAGGGTYYVADLETGTHLAERRDAVLTWVRESALDVEPDTDLTALFKNAVGVPQGLMTADFLGTPSTRKTIFDPLLRVEEYQHVYEELRDTVTWLRDRTGEVDQEIAALRVDADRIPETRDQVETLRAQLIAGQDQLDRAVTNLQRLEGERARLDQLESALAAIDGDLRAAGYEVSRRTDFFTAATQSLAAAREARRLAAESEPGYRTVLAVRSRLAALEEQRVERDALTAALSAAQSERQTIWGRIEQLDAALQAALAADQAALSPDLAERVRHQIELDAALRDLEATLRDIPRLDAQIKRLQADLAALERSMAAKQDRLHRARQAQESAVHLDDVQARFNDVSAQLAELGPHKRRLTELGDEGKKLKDQRLQLVDQVRRFQQLRDRLAADEPIAAGYDDLTQRRQALREQRIQLTAALDYQDLARAELHREHCPLLELRCPVVTADSALLDNLDRRQAEITAQRQTIDTDLAVLDQQLAAAKAAAESVQSLRVEVARLHHAPDQLERIETDLRLCLDQYHDLAASLQQESAWQDEQRALQAKLDELHQAVTLAAGLEHLEEQLQSDSDTHATRARDLAEAREQRAALGAAEQRAAALRVELTALGNPYQEQQDLLATARQRPGIEERIAAQQSLLTEAAGRVKALTGQLAAFAALDDEFSAQRALEQQSLSDYERHLQHREEARLVEEREQSVRETEAALAQAQKTQADLTTRRQALAAGYDLEQHAAVKRECEEAHAEFARQTTLHERRQTDLDSAEQTLTTLQRAADRLRLRSDERAELTRVSQAVTFIRDTIRSAGPRVTEVLLKNISQGANDIYAEIVDDHAVELRWDRDYEVLAQRGAETRKFAQLSGGEQMSAALAVRLALLKEMSEVDFAFFDEPTQNMDIDRRGNLAAQIRQVRGFDQLIVISHDDTFEHHTDNLIRLRKVDEETRVDQP
jgi:exonuclease SbcC